MAIYANLSHNKNTLLKIAESLKAYNKKVDEHFSDISNRYNGTTNKPFTKYVEGVSMRSIWGVRSLGINPATGEEVSSTRMVLAQIHGNLLIKLF